MASLTHGVKKRMSLMMTRKKTIEKKMSAEYTTLKHAVLRQKDTLEGAVPYVKRASHVAFADSYLSFFDLVANDTPVDSSSYDAVRDANDAAKAVHKDAHTPPAADSAPARLLAHVDAYIAELNTVAKEFAAVEKQFVETERYERKVGKLLSADKKTRADKDGAGAADKTTATAVKASDKTVRNMDKREVERAAFHTKLDSVIAMMKKTNAKYETILKCVYTAFWMSEDAFISATDSATKAVREKCKAEVDDLINLDVSKL